MRTNIQATNAHTYVCSYRIIIIINIFITTYSYFDLTVTSLYYGASSFGMKCNIATYYIRKIRYPCVIEPHKLTIYVLLY